MTFERLMAADILERDLQAKCVAWWNRSGIPGLLFHCPNEGKRGRLEAVSLGALGIMPGVADFIILLPSGRVHFIELKAKGGEQSAKQRRFERNAQVLGHTYDVVRSVEEFIGSVCMARRFHDESVVVDFREPIALP